MSLDTQDKKYIDKALERNRVQFRDEMEVFFRELSKENRDHMTALREGFEDQVKMLTELIQDRPTRSEVQTYISDELGPIRSMLTEHDLRISKLEDRCPA